MKAFASTGLTGKEKCIRGSIGRVMRNSDTTVLTYISSTARVIISDMNSWKLSVITLTFCLLGTNDVNIDCLLKILKLLPDRTYLVYILILCRLESYRGREILPFCICTILSAWSDLISWDLT